MTGTKNIMTGNRPRDDQQDTHSRGALVLTVPEAAHMLRVSRWSIYQLIRSRRLETVTIGRRRLVPAAAVDKLLDRLGEEAA